MNARRSSRRALTVASIVLVAALTGKAFAGGTVTAASGGSSSPAAGAAPRASVAAPGSDATIAAKVFTVGTGQVGDATVDCPAGSRVVGGGVGQTGSTSPAFGLVQASGPVDETGQTNTTESGDIARSWTVSVANKAGGPTREYRAYAICSKTSDATIAAKTLPLADNETNSANALCPAGKRAIGGGVGVTRRTTPLFGDVLQTGPVDETGQIKNTESGDVAKSWYALLYNYGGAHEYRVFALCSAGSDATIVAKPMPGEGGKVVDAVVPCAGGTRAVSGGVIPISGVGATRSVVQTSGPVDETGLTANTESADVARSWAVSVYNASTTGEFRAVAICLRETPAATTARCAGKAATIVGTPAADTLRGTPGPDVIAGLGGNDTISGLGGDDTICGGAGNDTISGGTGNDTIFGGAGNDILVGGPGLDRLDGGPGKNTVKP